MASLIKDLIKVLEEETGCYQLLREMADDKKDVIINGDLPSLQKMTQREQEMAGLLLRLEKQRTAITKDIALVTNQSNESMTVHKLIAMLEGQAEQEELAAVAAKLIGEVQPLKEANEINDGLLKQSLEFVDFTMNAIQSSRAPITTNNYQRKGYGDDSAGKRSFFDSKQ